MEDFSPKEYADTHIGFRSEEENGYTILYLTFWTLLVDTFKWIFGRTNKKW